MILTNILSWMIQIGFENNHFTSYIGGGFKMVLILQLLIMCCEIQLLFLIPSLKLVAPCSQNIGLHQGKETAVSQEPCYTYTHYSYLWLAGYMHSAVFPQYHFTTFIKVPSRRPYRTKAIQYMFACFGQHRFFAQTLY